MSERPGRDVGSARHLSTQSHPWPRADPTPSRAPANEGDRSRRGTKVQSRAETGHEGKLQGCSMARGRLCRRSGRWASSKGPVCRHVDPKGSED